MTADLTIRLLTPDLDWDQYLDLTARSFGPVDEARVRANIGPIVADGRCLGAFEGNRMVGSALFLDMRQWWHGRAVPMAGAAGVKIAPEDRGRGIGRAVMTALVELMAERGYPMTALYPATMTIYRSLGWEVAGHRQEAQLGPSDPIWWLLPEQDASIADRRSWMLRLLDAPAAIAARGFPATDLAVPLRITDDLRPANAGLWQLSVRDGTGCLCEFRTGQGDSPRPAASFPGSGAAPRDGVSPPGGKHLPLALGARGLAALYAGTPVATLRRAGLASGGSPAAGAALDGAFAATPYMLGSF